MNIQIIPSKVNGSEVINAYHPSHNAHHKPTSLVCRLFKHDFCRVLSTHDLARFNNGNLLFSVSYTELIKHSFDFGE